MNGVRRKIDWDDDEHAHEQWERDTGGAGEAGGLPFGTPSAKILSVGNVLARLDLLGTYDLAGTSVFSQAKSDIRATAPVHSSSVPFSWTSSGPEKSRAAHELLGPPADAHSVQHKSISNGSRSPPPTNALPANAPSTPASHGGSRHGSQPPPSPIQPEEAAPHKGADMGIVEWLKGNAGSPDWLTLDKWNGFGGRTARDHGLGGRTAREDAPLLAKLKEKGPPKTLCKNLPKREAGEQTPFGRERPKLLHTPDAIAMRQAIEAEVWSLGFLLVFQSCLCSRLVSRSLARSLALSLDLSLGLSRTGGLSRAGGLSRSPTHSRALSLSRLLSRSLSLSLALSLARAFSLALWTLMYWCLLYVQIILEPANTYRFGV
jgi:hypothetical protein